MGLRFNLLALLSLFSISGQVLADERAAQDLVEPASVAEYYIALADNSPQQAKTQSLGESLRKLQECAMAARCLACFGSLEPSCVEFNLGHWAWCLNPLNSVLLKCASNM